MTLNQLQVFLAAAETLSFAKTAERLFIAPSAVSRQIAAIEKELNTPLFIRNNNVLQLTAAGRHFWQGAKPMAERFQELRQETVDIGTGTSGRLRVCVQSDQQINPVFGRILRKFSALHPRVTLELNRLGADHIHDALSGDQFDVGIMLFQSDTVPAGFVRRSCVTESVSLGVHEALLERYPTLEALTRAAPFCLTAPDLYPAVIREDMRRLSRTNQLGSDPPVFDSEDSVELYTATGLGVTIVNESHILTAHPGIRTLPLGHVPTVQKGFIWRQDTDNPLVCAASDSLAHVMEMNMDRF